MRLEDVIPGLADAIAQERFDRSAAFLGLPETVCGVECRPLTLMDVLRLDCIGSPFVVGGEVLPVDVGAFLKLQCVHGWPRRTLALWRMARRMNSIAAAKEISQFVSDSFADAPGGKSISGAAYWTVAHSYIHVFGENYGWAPEVTLSHPLRCLFPQFNIIRATKDPSAPLFNPRSDAVRGAWLAEQNKRN